MLCFFTVLLIFYSYSITTTGSGPTLTSEQRNQLETMNPEFFEEVSNLGVSVVVLYINFKNSSRTYLSR